MLQFSVRIEYFFYQPVPFIFFTFIVLSKMAGNFFMTVLIFPSLTYTYIH